MTADDDLLQAIYRIGRLMGSRQVSARIAEAAGAEVTKQGVQVLRALYRFGQQQVAELASLAHMDVGAVSRQLRLLEATGLVERAPAAGDGRVALVSLTPSGRRVAKRIRDVGLLHLTNALQDWDQAERKELARLLTNLVDDLMATEITPVDRPGHSADRRLARRAR